MSKLIHGRAAWLVALAAALALAVAGCGSGGDDGGDDGAAASGSGAETITIGALLPLSGPAASTGIPVANGEKQAAAEVNDAGGIKAGEKTYKLKIATYDSGGDPAEGLSATTRMVESDGIDLLAGIVSSAVANALRPFLTQHQQDLAVVVNGATLPEVTETPNVFRIQADITQYNTRNVDYQAKLGWKRVGVVTDQKQAAHVAATPALLEHYKKLGIEVADQEKSETGQTDFSSIITKLKGHDLDGVYLRLYADEQLLFIKQARQVGWDIPITAVNSTPADQVGKVIPAKAMTDVYEIVPPTLGDLDRDGDSKAKAVTAEYKQRFGSDPGSLTLNGYESVKALAAAIEQAGSADAADVIKALSALEPYGELYPVAPQDGNVFGPEREVVVKFYASTWKNGKVVKTEPVE